MAKCAQNQGFSKIFCLAIMFLVVATPAIALAVGESGIDGAEGKIDHIVDLGMRILQSLLGLAGVIVGWIWAKGSQSAKDRLEGWLIGIVVAFSAVPIVNYFAS